MSEKLCPVLREPCIEHKCKFYVHLLGKDPQTGKEIDKFDCAIAFIPILLIEGAQQSRQAGAAIESFRNEMVKNNDTTMNRLLDAAVANRQLEFNPTEQFRCYSTS